MFPKVSVIIPAYNAGMFIDAAIASVLAQSYKGEVEIIVIDDASSDNTRELVVALADQHPQVSCIPNRRRKGPSGTRNTGLQQATGDYIAFLDADDLWLPTHLENGVGFLEKNGEIDIVFYNFNLVEYKTKALIGDWFSRHCFEKKLNVQTVDDDYCVIVEDMFNALIDESFIHLQSMLLRKTTLNGILFDETISRSEDRDFCIKLYLFAKARFAFKNVITGIYYRHENSLTSETPQNELAMLLDHLKILTFYLASYTLDASTAAKLRKIIFHKLMIASYLYRKLGNYKLAASTLGKSFQYRLDISQFKELAKIIVDLLLGNVLPRRRST